RERGGLSRDDRKKNGPRGKIAGAEEVVAGRLLGASRPETDSNRADEVDDDDDQIDRRQIARAPVARGAGGGSKLIRPVQRSLASFDRSPDGGTAFADSLARAAGVAGDDVDQLVRPVRDVAGVAQDCRGARLDRGGDWRARRSPDLVVLLRLWTFQ